MQVLEQEDGFRVSDDRFSSVWFLNKKRGWNRQMVAEILDLTNDLWNMAYNLGVGSVDRVQTNLTEVSRARENKI